MVKQSKTVHKKSRGRPAGTKYGETIPARLESATVTALDAWATSHDVSRSKAIRRLVEIGLTVESTASPSQRPKVAPAARAKELAAKAIENIIDPVAPLEERTERKRRLTKGPSEFREVRIDQPKPKR